MAGLNILERKETLTWWLELYCSEKLERRVLETWESGFMVQKGGMDRAQTCLSVGPGRASPGKMLQRSGSNRFVNRLLSCPGEKCFFC